MTSANTCILAMCITVATASWAGAQTCKTEYDSLMRQYVTKCSDGTRSKTEYDSLMKRYNTTIQTPGGGSQRCTQEYDRLMRQWVTTCR